MTHIDDIVINLNDGNLFVLNIILSFLMFGVALDIRIDDFKQLFQSPKIPLVGLLSEYLFLPLLALGLIYMIEPHPSIALGMLLVSVCPGGSVSNYMVHRSKGNSALSVLLTSFTTTAAIVITPIAFGFWAGIHPETSALLKTLDIDPQKIIKTVIFLILIPVSIGMFINHQYPKFTEQIKKPVSSLSMLVFLAFVCFALVKNYTQMQDYLHIVFFIVLIHNGLALLGGYQIARGFRLSKKDARAISIETGIQNSGLGLVLAFQIFEGLGGMVLILAWWGIWHLISGFGLSLIWGRNPVD
jgi:BASS family bile acid:Na+ symporter